MKKRSLAPYFLCKKGGKGIDQVYDHRPRICRK